MNYRAAIQTMPPGKPGAIFEQPFVCSWSGGKDSCLAMHRAVRDGAMPICLITMCVESGDRTRKCDEIDAFLERLAKDYAGPVYKVDERYSSVEAAGIIHAHGKKTGPDKKRIDRLAATIILQRFLDERDRP